MSGHNWKPGDVAETTYNRTISRAFVVESGHLCPPGHDHGMHWHGRSGGWNPIDDHAVTFRPLVVIDPEDREQVKRLDDLLWATRTAGEATDDLQAALREFAAPTPPRIKEPDVWGIVRAGCVHSDQVRTWMRHEDGDWYVVGTDTKNNPDDWDSLTNPVLVREGVAQ